MIRDNFGIVVQSNRDFPLQSDGGDSASRTALLALSGSEQDQDLLHKFLFVGGLVRHPFQDEWNKPELTSRDQLICWAAGVWRLLEGKIVTFKGTDMSFYLAQMGHKWFINKDFLAPDVRLMLLKSARVNASIWLSLLGYPFLLLKLFYNTLLNPGLEQNQFFAQCAVMGDFWIKALYKLHPDLEKNIHVYFDGIPWRDQPEIGEAMINYLHERVKK